MPVLSGFTSFGRRSLRLSKRRKKTWTVGDGGSNVPETVGDKIIVSETDYDVTPKKQTFHPRSRVPIRTHYHHYVQDYDFLHFPSPVPLTPIIKGLFIYFLNDLLTICFSHRLLCKQSGVDTFTSHP